MKVLKQWAVVSLLVAGARLKARADFTYAPVLNNSFESPTVDPSVLPVSLSADNWNIYGPSYNPYPGVVIPHGGVGIFPNTSPSSSTHIYNLDGNQAAYMFPAGYGTDPTDTADYQKPNTLQQTLSSNFTAGALYSITVAVSNAGSAPDASSVLTYSLYYNDPTTGNPDVVASGTVQNDAAHGLQVNYMEDFTATGIAPSGADQQPMQVTITAVGDGAGEFDVDNVRVPEPTSMGFAALVAGGLLSRRRRRAAV